MIKLILTLLLIIPFNINARECDNLELVEYSKSVNNITYKLEYLDNYLSMNGDKLEGYFKLDLNLPENYYGSIIVDSSAKFSHLRGGIKLKGGVYTLNLFHKDCNKPVRKIDLRIPHYKNYCDRNHLENCTGKEIWFDGTYENKKDVSKPNSSTKVDYKLLIVIVSLILIITISILLFKRRRSL